MSSQGYSPSYLKSQGGWGRAGKTEMFKNPSLKRSEIKQSKGQANSPYYRASPLGTHFWAHEGEDSVWEQAA